MSESPHLSQREAGVIPRREWEWFGTSGHFIAATRCCFHMHTRVGRYRVSSVGCYHPAPDWEREKPPETIGSQRLYETMVFRLDIEGEPVDWSEVDSSAYDNEAAAAAGHVAMCEKWAVWPESSLVEQSDD